MPQYNTFIVRIWTNDGLHGQVKHVRSQEKCDFHDLHDMMEFMLEHVRQAERLTEFFKEETKGRE